MDTLIKKIESSAEKRIVSAVDLVKKLDISYQTLNYYTTIGLLEMTGRKGRTRFYNEEDVIERLERIKALQNKGYTLRLINEAIGSSAKRGL
ncbi:MAG: MerR family transcriptional regulator [Candidatus Omnitrophota bacterium]